MMKWKVVKNPRSSSADRSLECLKNDVQQQLNNINNNNVHKNNDNNNNNNNEESGQDPKSGSPPAKDTNKQKECKKPSLIATDCIPLKSFLGLTRQRSETNLSGIGLSSASTEPRRSRSEVRGGGDRLTVGYHTAGPHGKTRSSSPNGWLQLRGRKRERECRTVVAGSGGRTSRARSGDCCRTIVDGSERPKVKKRGGEEDIIEEEIYSEIHAPEKKLTDGDFKGRVVRKKGMAPKPQISKALFNGRTSNSPASLNEAVLSKRQPVSKTNHHQTYNGGRNNREPPVKLNNLRNCEVVKAKNNINQARSLHLAVVEVHKVDDGDCKNNNNNNTDHDFTGQTPGNQKDQKNKPDHGTQQSPDSRNDNKTDRFPQHSLANHDVKNNKSDHGTQHGLANHDVKNNKSDHGTQHGLANHDAKNNKSDHGTQQVKDTATKDTDEDEPMPFHIDTPDYSTLDSVTCQNNSFSLSTEDLTFSGKEECDDSPVRRETPPSLSSILRTDCEGKEYEPKKTVRFEKLDPVDQSKRQEEESDCAKDLIEKYKRHKIEGLTAKEDDDTSDGTYKKIECPKKEDGNASDFAQDLIEKYKRYKTEGLAQTEKDGEHTTCASSYAKDLIERYTRQKTEGLEQTEVDSPEESSRRSENVLDIEKYKRHKTEGATAEKEDGHTCASSYAKDLIERYTRQKTEGPAQTEIESTLEDSSSRLSENVLDINSNEIDPEDSGKAQQLGNDCTSKSMTVNVLVRNCAPSSTPLETEGGVSQFVVKKSFVLTVAKQEKGFRSLCEHKKPEPVVEAKPDQISVTFLCSGPPSEGWGLPPRPRSTSVPPPRSLPPVEVIPLPAARGRSRERRSKERQHCRKSHRARKKDAVFVMPQAVIDELSQVLEKRKPSLEEIRPRA